MEKVYDLKQLEELSGGMPDMVNTMIDTFLEHSPGQLHELLNAYEKGNWAQMGALAHKIKPSIDLFGIHSLYEIVRRIEKNGKTDTPGSELDDDVKKVESVLIAAFEQLRALQSNSKPE